VKTDRIDALAICLRLDGFTRGNRMAFSIVRVPTEDEERRREGASDASRDGLADDALAVGRSRAVEVDA